MGRLILGIVLAVIVGLCALGFTCWLGLALSVVTVGQPTEVELDLLLCVAIVVAISVGTWIGRRVALRR